MAWGCYMLAVFAMVFSVCSQKRDSSGKNVKEPPPGTGTICDTSECVISAAEMVKKMNLSADPCQDFNEFACGHFIRESVIPEGMSAVSTFTVLADENKVILNDIIVQGTNSTQPQYLSNIQRFYRSCFDEAQIETVGLTPYFKDKAFVDDWPTLNPRWNGTSFDLKKVTARYFKVLVDPIFAIMIINNMANTSENAIYLFEGVLGMEQEYYSRHRNNSIIRAYEKYLVETAVALNGDRAVAEQDAKEVVDLEIELSKIMVSRENKRNFSQQHNPVRLKQLSSLYPELDIAQSIRDAFNIANITLADDETIINLFPTYIGNISLVVHRFSNRTLQNMFGFKYAVSRTGRLTRRMRDIRLDFERAYTGTTTEKPRWKDCVESTSRIFWMGLSKQFVARHFSEEAKRNVNEMIDNLKEEFRKMIEKATWMSESTTREAHSKLEAMARKIGYPDVDFEESDIEKAYENHTMREDDYYNNRVLGNKLARLELLASLREPVNRNKWTMAPHDVNAFYSGFRNEIVFMAGIMQAPFFSESFQDYVNYGAIGSVIGHEITHGFDDRGSQYDANGNLRNWWTAVDRQTFLNRSQCMVDQNSSFHVDEIDMNLSGKNTQGESEADRGGLIAAFRAYRKHVRKHGQQPRLTDLDLSQDQVFFLAFAQMYCEKMTPERLVSQVTTNVHPPGKYRVIGTLQNSEDFAEVYNCSRRAYMNPEKKCGVW